MNNINLNNLKYFLEVVETQNITKASNNLCLSQPALTKSIKVLESELNTQLFNRSKKGVVLTPEGEVLYAYVKDMFKRFDTTLNTLYGFSDNTSHLYIGSTTTNFLEPLLDVLNYLRHEYPKLQIHLICEDVITLNNYLKTGKLDIIIKNDYEYFEDSKLIKQFYVQDKFIASTKYYESYKDKVFTLEDILNQSLVLLSKDSHGRKNFDNYLKSKGLTRHPNYEFNSYSLCRELIKNGFGIGIGNPIHYQNDDFIILNTDFLLPKRTFDICYLKSSDNKYIKDIIDYLK